MILKRLKIAFILLALLICIGISGYILIERWNFLESIYMTIITIASVGYMEVKPLSDEGRIFTIFLIIFGMGILLFCISTFTAFLVEGELSDILRRRRMEKEIAKLKDHYIVCGAGRIGQHIIEELLKTKRQFVVVDNNEETCKKLGEQGILYIKGDATNTAVLKSANAENAKGIFCALPTDAENLLLILTAKGINPEIKVVSKANEYESEDKMKKAGADSVVLPEFIGGLRMASEMIRPETVKFLDHMLKDKERIFRVEDIKVGDNPLLKDKTLLESGLLEKEGVCVVAIKRDNKYVFNPSKEERLKEDDFLILIGEANIIRKLKKPL